MDLWPVIRILTLVIAKSLFLTDTRDTALSPVNVRDDNLSTYHPTHND